MSTTGLVMTVTDELLAEIEDGAKGASHWNLDACFQVVEEGYLPDEWYWHIGHYDEGNQYPVLLVETDQYDAPPEDAKAVARHYANCGSRNIIALVTELRRLRADNAELAQSLAESRANDQAAMGWLTSLRLASGDRGERMLPELVSHIEELAKDAGRLEWMVKEGAVIARMNGTGRPMCYQVSFPFESCQQLDWFPSWREAVDAMMSTQ